MQYLILVFIFVAIAIWWLRFRTNRRASVAKITRSSINEQDLAQLQAAFERRLADDCDLPDGIRGRDAYIYWNLMRSWFDKLIAVNRYDSEYAKKLRSDWCEYLQLLSRARTSKFLALETSNEAMASTYGQEAELASRSIEAIQNAFAAAIGAEAIEALREIRNRDGDAFDRSGKRPVAPTGHHYFPISIRPYIEECQPKPSNKEAS